VKVWYFILISVACVAAAWLIFWTREKLSGGQDKDGKTHRSGAKWDVFRETLRVFGETIFAVGIVVILVKSPLESYLTEKFEDRLEKEFSIKLDGLWQALLSAPALAEHMQKYIAKADFIYKDYEIVLFLSKTMKSPTILGGRMTTTWTVRNVANEPRTYECRPKYFDVDTAAGGAQDSVLQLIDPPSGQLIKEWCIDTSKTPARLTIELASGKSVRVRKMGKAYFGQDNYLFPQTKYACEGMKIELTIPDYYAITCDFKHPGATDKEECELQKLPSGDGTDRYVAQIKRASFPFHGIWLSWDEKQPTSSRP
jgi:hypothetical protein